MRWRQPRIGWSESCWRPTSSRGCVEGWVTYIELKPCRIEFQGPLPHLWTEHCFLPPFEGYFVSFPKTQGLGYCAYMKILVENCKMYTVLTCRNPDTLIFAVCTLACNERNMINQDKEMIGTGNSISRALSNEFLKLFFPASQPGRSTLLFMRMCIYAWG